MKTTVFFIMVALLVLGYLHLLTMYAQRIDSSVISHHVATSNSIQQDFKQSHQQLSKQYQSAPPLSDTSVQHPPPLLSATETKQLQELAAFSSQELPDLVQRIPDHQGRPIPNDKATLLQQLADLDDPQIRAQRVLYIITPTHKRITQRVDLMRLQQTLTLASLQYHHSLIYWIILEDAPTCSHAVRNIAQESGLYFAHKAVHSDNNNKRKKKKTPHRGLAQRNEGLETVLQVGKEGVIYFADDDNGYDSRLFAELLFTRHTSIFAVGLSGGAAYERCRVDPTTGKVDAILSTWKPKYNVGKRVRKFPMDMAGFALSTTALLTTKARFRPQSTAGMLETDFLSLLVADVAELEPLAANCTRILAWHVKTTEPQWANNPELDGDGAKTFSLIKGLL